MMTKKTRPSRRFFLRGLTYSASISLLSISSKHAWGTSHAPSGVLHLDLLQILNHPDSAKVIGRKYLLTSSEVTDVKTLANLICYEKTSNSNSYHYKHFSELNEFVQTRIRKDFEVERVVLVDGWILSQTEARLYALASLV